MKKRDLKKYKDGVVYFFHRERKEFANPSRWSRGIVHRGKCYDLSTQYRKNDVPIIHLEAMKSEYIHELHPLKRNQQTFLEQRVTCALKQGRHYLSGCMKIVFDPWREDLEEERQEKREKKQESFPETPQTYQSSLPLIDLPTKTYSLPAPPPLPQTEKEWIHAWLQTYNIT